MLLNVRSENEELKKELEELSNRSNHFIMILLHLYLLQKSSIAIRS